MTCSCLVIFVSLWVLLLGNKLAARDSKCTCDFKTSLYTLSIKCKHDISQHEISKCIGDHKDAKRLVFTDSFLTTIPTEIRMLKQLTHLDLSRNNIQAMDLSPLGEVCNILETFLINDNMIQKLEKGSMDCLHSLVTFSVTNNSLSLIENGTFNNNLQMLEHVYVMYNSLTTLDTSVFFLPQLYNGTEIRVNATWNSINRLTNYKNISITDVHRYFRFELVLTHNNFTGFNWKYYRKMFNITKPLPQLYALWNCGIDLRFNPFICDCQFEPAAKYLKIFRPMDPDNPVFSVTCHSPKSLAGMTVYRVPLNQFNCSIRQGCPEGCSCTETVELRLLTVTCDSDYKSTTLPRNVPTLDTIYIHVNIKNGELRELSSREYLTNTTLLDVSGCQVNSISTSILSNLMKINTVYLHDNALMAIPRDIEMFQFDGLKILTLRGNQFVCDCHSLWFKKWLIKNKRFVSDISRVLCESGPGKGNAIIDVKDSDFECLYPITTNEVLIIVFSVVFLMIVVFVLIHYNRTNIHVLLIAYCNVYIFRRKAKGTFEYDVFISHSSKDDEWVLKELMETLESHQPPYKILFDERDFQPGQTIVYNVIRAIRCSRTTLLVLTNNFLRSDWCMMEFKQAYLKLLKEKDINLIVIVMEKLDESLMGQELQFYLKTNVYISFSDKYFWAKLFQALPMARKPCVNSSQESDILSESSPLLVN